MALKTKGPGPAVLPTVQHVPPSVGSIAVEPLAMLFVGCWSDGPAAPGEPFSISWQIWSINIGPDLGDIYGQIYLGGTLIHTTPTVTFVAQQGGGDTGLQHDQGIVPPADPTLRAKLYQLGTKTLQFRAVASGPAAAKWSLNTDFDLDIEPGFAPASNPPDGAQGVWDLQGAPDQVNFYRGNVNVDWGSKFALKATITNTGTAGLKGNFHLHVVSQDDPTDVQDSGAFEIEQSQPFLEPGQMGQLLVANVDAEHFTWLSPVGFFPIEKPYQDHRYTWSIVSNLSDEFGNVYPEQDLALLVVHITVPGWKWGLATAAAATLVVAVILLNAPWPVDVVGAALVLVAGGLGLAALDPPEPSPRYRERVKIKPQAIPEKLQAEGLLAPFAEFVALLHQILAAHAALTETESRLIGARQAGDTDAAALQTDGYLAAIDYLTSAAGRLQAATADAVKVDGMERILGLRAARRILSPLQREIPPARRRAWTRAGLPKKTQGQVEALLHDATFKEWTKDGIRPCLGLIAPLLNQYARQRRDQAPAVLNSATGRPEPTPTNVAWKAKGR